MTPRLAHHREPSACALCSRGSSFSSCPRPAAMECRSAVECARKPVWRLVVLLEMSSRSGFFCGRDRARRTISYPTHPGRKPRPNPAEPRPLHPRNCLFFWCAILINRRRYIIFLLLYQVSINPTRPGRMSGAVAGPRATPGRAAGRVVCRASRLASARPWPEGS